jgi:predicted XRE-type DNA-binding protein
VPLGAFACHINKLLIRRYSFMSILSKNISWDSIECVPESPCVRAKKRHHCAVSLMVALKAHMARSNLTQAQIAKLFGVTQPRVSDLLRGKINVFGLDALVNMAAAAGLRVKISIREAA